MSVAFDHRDAGTPEADWESVDLDAAALTLDAARLVVFAAHPDDETLGAGGLIATAAAIGLEVCVVVATDGEAADTGHAHLGRVRRAELVAAMAQLAPAATLRFLGLPDGGLRESTAELERAITAELAVETDTLIATTWWGDGHRDHRVLGEMVARCAGGARVLGFPIWYWHWGSPQAPDPGPWRSLALTQESRDAKRRALTAYASQLAPSEGGPILHDGMLEHFTRAAELFVERTTTARPSVAAAHFDEFFARHDDPWGFESRWYERRKRALLLAALPRERFRRGLELGCATGVLTDELADRCDDLLAVDASAVAVERARNRLAARARVEQALLPTGWPSGEFDLIVLSEVGYYLSAADLESTLDRIDGSLTSDGVLVACHWRHPIAEAPSTGDAVHEAIGRSRLRRLVRHIEEDLVLEIFGRHDALSVARAEGLA